MSIGKTHGVDAIPTEVYKSVGPLTIQTLTKFLQSMRAKAPLPRDKKDISIVDLYKRKGNILF